jgi:predicted DNA-binding transcriptional regulator YafY
LIGDPEKWDQKQPLGEVQASLLGVFERAFTQRLLLTFDYRDRTARVTSRKVEPQGLLLRAPFWYLIGWDRERNGPSLFRMDGIRSARLVAGETFQKRGLNVLRRVCPNARRKR